MLKSIRLGAGIAVASAGSALAISEDFQGGLNGWTVGETDNDAQGRPVNPGGALVTLETGGQDGTGDLFVQFEDNRSEFKHTIFGTGWTGDLSAFNGGSLSLDYLISGSGADIPTFGFLRVIGGGASVGVDVVPTSGPQDWTNIELDFSASTFGTTEATWSSILMDVTEIRFQVEGINGFNERNALDNVVLTEAPAPIPLPATGLLALAGLGALAATRRPKVA